MINYLMLGTNDLEKSAAFYDALLEGLGGQRAYGTDTFIAWSFGKDKTMLSVTKPHDGKQATAGNGVMVALSVDTAETVDRLHGRALELGASDEGAPGLRGKSFYAGYFRDPDGNKLNFFCIQSEAG